MKKFKIAADVKSALKIKSDIKSFLNLSELASTAAIKSETARLKNALRGDIRSAGLGSRLANTWQSREYPAGRASTNAASLTWSKAPEIIQGHEGVTIRSGKGFWLAIPTKNVPTGRRGRKLTISEAEARFGRLRYVYRSRTLALLVADDIRASYSKSGQFRGYKKSSKSIISGKQRDPRHVNKFKVMYVLKAQVSLRKRLDVKKRFDEAGSRLGNTLYQERQKILKSVTGRR